MTRTRQHMIGAAILVVAFGIAWLCYCASWAVLEWGHAGQAATVNLGKLGAAADGITATTARLNGPHGTLTMLDEDVGAARSLIIHADLVARHEQQQLSKFDSQEETLFADTHKALTAGAGALAQAQTDLQTFEGLIGALTGAVSEAKATEKDFHALVPDMKRLTKGMADTSEHTAVITDNTAKVSTHYEKKIDAPDKPKPWYIKIAPFAIQLAWEGFMAAK